MNKNDIISAVSIEFGLSKEQTEITVNNIFINIAQSFKKNKVLEIQKFGKFKLTAEKDSKVKLAEVRFSPSKKLSVRVNSKFDNLKKTKIKFGSVPIINDNLGSPVKKNENPSEIKKSEINAKEEPKEVKINAQSQRKLISDDLVKLHKEITKDDKDDSSSTNNLWG
jgi:nucleoid DNA-binding protein